MNDESFRKAQAIYDAQEAPYSDCTDVTCADCGGWIDDDPTECKEGVDCVGFDRDINDESDDGHANYLCAACYRKSLDGECMACARIAIIGEVVEGLNGKHARKWQDHILKAIEAAKEGAP